MKNNNWVGFQTHQKRKISPLMASFVEKITNEKARLAKKALIPKLLAFFLAVAWAVTYFLDIQLINAVPVKSHGFYLLASAVFAAIGWYISSSAKEANNANKEIMALICDFRQWRYLQVENAGEITNTFLTKESPIKQLLKAELGFKGHNDGLVQDINHYVEGYIETKTLKVIELQCDIKYSIETKEDSEDIYSTYFNGLIISQKLDFTCNDLVVLDNDYLGLRSFFSKEQLIERYQLNTLQLDENFENDYSVFTDSLKLGTVNDILAVFNTLDDSLGELKKHTLAVMGNQLLISLDFDNKTLSENIIESPTGVDDTVKQLIAVEDLIIKVTDLLNVK